MSHSIYNCGGFKAESYRNTRTVDVPTFNELLSPTSPYYVASADMEMDVESHLTWQKKPTRWISTTTSFMAALQRMFIRHNQGFESQLFVISTEMCQDSGIFVSPDLVKSLPGLLQRKQISGSKLKFASQAEVLVHGKIPADAIVGFSTSKLLNCPSLDKLAPGLSSLKYWDDYKRTLLGRNQWLDHFSGRFPLLRHATDNIVENAAQLASLFGSNDPEVNRQLISRICNLDFMIDPGLGDGRTAIDKAIIHVQDPLSQLTTCFANVELALDSHSAEVERVQKSADADRRRLRRLFLKYNS
jgi:hypothetical protein